MSARSSEARSNALRGHGATPAAVPLSYAALVAAAKGRQLVELTRLDLFGLGLSAVDALAESSPPLAALRVLSVSHNSLTNLAPLASLRALEELYARNNALSLTAALAPLTALPHLRVLSLENNPAQAAPDYRTLALATCHGLEHLDAIAVLETDHAAVAIALRADSNLRERLAALLTKPSSQMPLAQQPSLAPALQAALALLPLLSRADTAALAAAATAAITTPRQA